MMISVVVPTFNEGDNPRQLVERLQATLHDQDWEILFVDDSTDDTPERLRRLGSEFPQVRVIHREDGRGLASAVALGLKEASGTHLVVMDADLQHPPELVPRLVRALQAGADLAVASRYVPGGDAGGLTPWRKAVSLAARLLAHVVLVEARWSRDPLAGFFAVRRQALAGASLQPTGWKILLEIMVSAQIEHAVDIPYRFAERVQGESKLGWQVQKEYLLHLAQLFRRSQRSRRFWLFAGVGLSGVLINMGLYAALVRGAHWPPVLSGTISTHAAMASNFFLNDRFTWADRRDVQPHTAIRAGRFWAVSELGILLNIAVIALATWHRMLNPMWANLLGIGAAAYFSYTLHNHWTWSAPHPEQAPAWELASHDDPNEME